MVVEHFDHGEANVQPRRSSPSRLRIAIQDSTEDPEAVRRVVNHLMKAGYRRIFVGDPWTQTLETTRILAQNGDDLGAATVRADLGMGEVLVESTGNLGSDITIVLGEDWQNYFPDSSIQFQESSVKSIP